MSLRALCIAGAGVAGSAALLVGVAAMSLTSVLGSSASGSTSSSSTSPSSTAVLSTTALRAAAPSADALATIPRLYLETFEAAASSCPGLSWAVLAGIGRVETDFGADTQPSSAGAVGPMQFEPATFAEYGSPVPSGGSAPPSPLDPVDAIWAAARLLCANGAKNGTHVADAIDAYNHTGAYVREVLSYAASYIATVPVLDAPNETAVIAIDFALDQLGTPYVWGGETPGVGFDCSGLTQAAYAAAGIHIPRTSTAQWTTLPHVPLADLEPGDLVFFEPGEFSPDLPGHVGIYIGDDEMVDAPHTGTDVQIDALSAWPSPMGAARPWR